MQLRKEKTLHSKCCEINELIEWIVINCNCIKPLTGYLEKPVNKYICVLFKKLVHRYTWCTVDVIPIPTSIPIPSQSNSGYRSPHNQTTQLEIFIRFSCQTSHKSRPRYIYIHPHTRTQEHTNTLSLSWSLCFSSTILPDLWNLHHGSPSRIVRLVSQPTAIIFQNPPSIFCFLF